MKPRGLGATTVAMAVLNLGSFVGIEWTRRGVVVMVAFGGSAGLRRALVLLAGQELGKTIRHVHVNLDDSQFLGDVGDKRRPFCNWARVQSVCPKPRRRRGRERSTWCLFAVLA